MNSSSSRRSSSTKDEEAVVDQGNLKEGEREERSGSTSRRRRLSRKEQKARKKQKRKNSNINSSIANTSLSNNNESHQQVDDKEEEAPAATATMLTGYVPTPIPTWEEIKKEHNNKNNNSKTKSLGKWFPSAVVLKSPIHYSNDHKQDKNKQQQRQPKASLLLFYQYASPKWSESRVSQLMAYLCRIAQQKVLGGRIRVAREGLNATISSVDYCNNDYNNNNRKSQTAALALREFAEDLKHYDPDVFANTDFKYIDNLSPDRHFSQLNLYPVEEIVYYGFDEAPLRKSGVHLPPQHFHQKLTEPNTVVIDVRNHYEAAIGRFDGQEHITSNSNSISNNNKDEKGEGKELKAPSPSADNSTAAAAATKNNVAAKYIDPKMRKSTDFATWLEKEQTQSQLKNKQVLLYCTGGVRCERASAYLNHKYGDKLHMSGVYQLQGGIEAYLKEFSSSSTSEQGNDKPGGYWRGKNFVFDKREAVDAANPDGDGGVIRKHNKNTKSTAETHCAVCKTPWDRYVGKKKCCTCGVPILMCDKCMSSQKKNQDVLVRCPLCIEEGVTVRASEVEYTNNGVNIKTTAPTLAAASEDSNSNSKNNTINYNTKGEKKAAPSVLKWGGGHASLKKNKRLFRHKMCKFGVNCKRYDCFFRHPRDKDNDTASLAAASTTAPINHS